MEELAHLKKKLEKAIADADENEALDIIRALDRVSITVDSLGVPSPPALPFPPFLLRSAGCDRSRIRLD
jgi:hypothetical protein